MLYLAYVERGNVVFLPIDRVIDVTTVKNFNLEGYNATFKT